MHLEHLEVHLISEGKVNEDTIINKCLKPLQDFDDLVNKV